MLNFKDSFLLATKNEESRKLFEMCCNAQNFADFNESLTDEKFKQFYGKFLRPNVNYFEDAIKNFSYKEIANVAYFFDELYTGKKCYSLMYSSEDGSLSLPSKEILEFRHKNRSLLCYCLSVYYCNKYGYNLKDFNFLNTCAFDKDFSASSLPNYHHTTFTESEAYPLNNTDLKTLLSCPKTLEKQTVFKDFTAHYIERILSSTINGKKYFFLYLEKENNAHYNVNSSFSLYLITGNKRDNLCSLVRDDYETTIGHPNKFDESGNVIETDTSFNTAGSHRHLHTISDTICFLNKTSPDAKKLEDGLSYPRAKERFEKYVNLTREREHTNSSASR